MVLRGLAIALVLAVSTAMAGCTGSDQTTVLTTEPARHEVLVDGQPGWIAAVEQPPTGVGDDAVWTGKRLVAVGYGDATEGRLRVVTYDPARGDWIGLTAPFGATATRDAVVGFDSDNRIVVIASCVGAADCPAGTREIRTLDANLWTEPTTPRSAATVTSAATDGAVEFTGPVVNGAGFSVDGQPLVVGVGAVGTIEASGLDDPHYCSVGSTVLASQRVDDAPVRLDLRWRTESTTWTALDPPAELLADLRDDPSSVVGPVCGPAGLAITAPVGANTRLYSVAADRAEPRWRTCDIAGRTSEPLLEVPTDDGRLFAVLAAPDGSARTTVVECVSGQSSKVATVDGAVPDRAFQAGAALVLVTLGSKLEIRVLAI